MLRPFDFAGICFTYGVQQWFLDPRNTSITVPAVVDDNDGIVVKFSLLICLSNDQMSLLGLPVFPKGEFPTATGKACVFDLSVEARLENQHVDIGLTWHAPGIMNDEMRAFLSKISVFDIPTLVSGRNITTHTHFN